MTLPMVEALRAEYPCCRITWATDREAAPLLTGHRGIDQTVVLPDGWLTTPGSLRQTGRRLRQQRFDVSIDCQGRVSSALVGWLAGAPCRIGPRRRRRGGWSRRLNNCLVQPVFRHWTDRALELLIPLEIHAPTIRWHLPIHEPARRWAARWRRTIASERLAILSPGAGWPSKLWESDRYAAVARYLRDRYRYRSVIPWGSETERQLAQLIVFQAQGAAILAPDMDLIHLAALIDQADLFLGPDSAPLHLAAALGTTSIGLYGATRPERSGPYGQHAIGKTFESGSRRHRRAASNAAMRQIGTDHVCQLVDQLESNRSQRRSA